LGARRLWRALPGGDSAAPLALSGPVGAVTLNASALLAVAGKRTTRQQEIIARLGPLLAPTLARYGINTPLRQAHFLGQCAHECDRFCTLEEYASGRAYEGRADLGNSQPGDGVRFKGRGLIQTTGRANYKRAATRLDLPLLDKPELLATAGPALEAACLYWQDRGLNRLADRDDILAVTRAINGGTNGLNDRRVLTARAKRVLGL
jgi:putative chitinase